jgi:hypothetical protein
MEILRGAQPLKDRPRPMSASETTSFKDYDLVCGARAADHGMFAPTLVVSRRTWPSRPRIIALTRGSFATEAEAIEAARTQGVQWVTDFG